MLYRDVVARVNADVRTNNRNCVEATTIRRLFHRASGRADRASADLCTGGAHNDVRYASGTGTHFQEELQLVSKRRGQLKRVPNHKTISSSVNRRTLAPSLACVWRRGLIPQTAFLYVWREQSLAQPNGASDTPHIWHGNVDTTPRGPLASHPRRPSNAFSSDIAQVSVPQCRTSNQQRFLVRDAVLSGSPFSPASNFRLQLSVYDWRKFIIRSSAVALHKIASIWVSWLYIFWTVMADVVRHWSIGKPARTLCKFKAKVKQTARATGGDRISTRRLPSLRNGNWSRVAHAQIYIADEQPVFIWPLNVKFSLVPF